MYAVCGVTFELPAFGLRHIRQARIDRTPARCRQEIAAVLSRTEVRTRLVREPHQFLADKVVECALGAEAPPDSLRCSTCLTHIFSNLIRGPI
jgi:hypothetical protein